MVMVIASAPDVAATRSAPLPSIPGPSPPKSGKQSLAKRSVSWTGKKLTKPKPANRRGPTVGTALTITLTKPTPETRWGVMPGLLDGVVAVFALDPTGVAKEKLRPCDQIVQINGVDVDCHVQAVELINTAHNAAGEAGCDCKIEIFRPIETPEVPLRLEQLELTLLKPTADTSWGVMPGRLPGGQLVVHGLNPKGFAKNVLEVGDRLITIDGTLVRSEEHVVDLLNDAHSRATATTGAVVSLVRINGDEEVEGQYIGFKDVVSSAGFAGGSGGMYESSAKVKTPKVTKNQKGVFSMECTLGAVLEGPL